MKPKKPQIIPRPASHDEAGLFFAQTPEQDARLGCIGHVRMDFGRYGTEFWPTWHSRGAGELNSPEFKAELGEVVNALRESVLKDLTSMKGYCREHGGEISGGWAQNYGYIVETERYRYCLRCNPIPGDYQAYLTCYDKQVQAMHQACHKDRTPIAIDSLAALKRAIKPGTELMATYHANHPEIVGLVRVVTEVQTNAFYSVIKGKPDHRFSTCNYGKGFRSDFEKASCYQFDGTSIKVMDARKRDGSILCEFQVYEQEMKMEAQEENEKPFTMTIGGM